MSEIASAEHLASVIHEFYSGVNAAANGRLLESFEQRPDSCDLCLAFVESAASSDSGCSDWVHYHCLGVLERRLAAAGGERRHRLAQLLASALASLSDARSPAFLVNKTAKVLADLSRMDGRDHLAGVLLDSAESLLRQPAGSTGLRCAASLLQVALDERPDRLAERLAALTPQLCQALGARLQPPPVPLPELLLDQVSPDSVQAVRRLQGCLIGQAADSDAAIACARFLAALAASPLCWCLEAASPAACDLLFYLALHAASPADPERLLAELAWSAAAGLLQPGGQRPLGPAFLSSVRRRSLAGLAHLCQVSGAEDRLGPALDCLRPMLAELGAQDEQQRQLALHLLTRLTADAGNCDLLCQCLELWLGLADFLANVADSKAFQDPEVLNSTRAALLEATGTAYWKSQFRANQNFLDGLDDGGEDSEMQVLLRLTCDLLHLVAQLQPEQVSALIARELAATLQAYHQQLGEGARVREHDLQKLHCALRDLRSNLAYLRQLPYPPAGLAELLLAAAERGARPAESAAAWPAIAAALADAQCGLLLGLAACQPEDPTPALAVAVGCLLADCGGAQAQVSSRLHLCSAELIAAVLARRPDLASSVQLSSLLAEFARDGFQSRGMPPDAQARLMSALAAAIDSEQALAGLLDSAIASLAAAEVAADIRRCSLDSLAAVCDSVGESAAKVRAANFARLRDLPARLASAPGVLSDPTLAGPALRLLLAWCRTFRHLLGPQQLAPVLDSVMQLQAADLRWLDLALDLLALVAMETRKPFREMAPQVIRAALGPMRQAAWSSGDPDLRCKLLSLAHDCLLSHWPLFFQLEASGTAGGSTLASRRLLQLQRAEGGEQQQQEQSASEPPPPEELFGLLDCLCAGLSDPHPATCQLALGLFRSLRERRRLHDRPAVRQRLLPRLARLLIDALLDGGHDRLRDQLAAELWAVGRTSPDSLLLTDGDAAVRLGDAPRRLIDECGEDCDLFCARLAALIVSASATAAAAAGN
ncbi:hypothetical protein BOX15_Mlig018760g1 [Macrostomum lignano]|uniref:Uncharacterized protein n=1 Tax=Macrostomum lignano TaxID=282301 RepID=A0A267GIZ8_9PLAT|nr:hypothetical protein BOX15_Mlig018760g1 [Macrostomum lignano]